MSNLGTVLSGISALTSGGALPVANFASYLMTGQGLANHLPFIGPITQAAGNQLDAALQYEMGRDRGTPPPVTITPTVRAMNEGEQAMADQAMKQLRTFREGGNVDMGMTRAQLEEQIRGFANGGTPDPFQGYLTPAPPAAGAPNQSPFRGYLTPPSAAPSPAPAEDSDEDEFMRRLMLLQQALQGSQTPSSLTVPDFDERFGQYQSQLRNVMGPRERSNIFDLASTVGRSMLAADPTAGAFSSMGMGFAEFDAQQTKRREAQRAEDRAVAMKAFEMAQKDVSSAQDLLNQYEIYKAKQDSSNEIDYFVVQDPNGISLRGRIYQQGEEIPLTPSEAFSVRDRIGSTSGGKGYKTTATGMAATYMSRADAEAVIQGLGLSPDNPNYERAVGQITASSPEQIGTPVIVGGNFAELTPYIKGDEVTNVMLGASKAAGQTPFNSYASKRLDLIAKSQDQFNSNAVSVLPQVEDALTLLLDPTTETGKLTELLAPLKRSFTQAFGTETPEIVALDRLEAIANALGPKMRPVGSGSTSDMEFRAYKQALLSIGNTKMANYLALYAFKKMTENAIDLNRLEQNLLTSGKYMNMEDINNEIMKADNGIWEKWTGSPDDEAAVMTWYNNLPSGAVILNRDVNGNVLFEGIEGPYIVKDWEKAMGTP